MPPLPYELMEPKGSDQSDEWIKLGRMAHADNKIPVAIHHYSNALRLDPQNAVATHNLAIALVAQTPGGDINAGLITMERAALLDGVHPEIKMSLALMAFDAQRYEESFEAAREAVRMRPGEVKPLLTLAMLLSSGGWPEEALSLHKQIIAKEPRHPIASSAACFAQTLCDCTPAEMHAMRKAWHEANRFEGKKRPHAAGKPILERCRNCKGESTDATGCKICKGNTFVRKRALRVGYVGGDFKMHSASMIFRRVLWHHDPTRVEMYCYSTLPVPGPGGDPTLDRNTKRFMECCGVKFTEGKPRREGEPNEQKPDWPTDSKGNLEHTRWRDATKWDDEAFEDQIRKDGIDILVDLAAHTGGNRLTVFTRKPAPIQVGAWGFAHGTGCPEIDWFFADPLVIPEEEHQHYEERIWNLPCVVCFEEPEGKEYDLKASSLLPLRRNGYITFGTYCRYEKTSEKCLRVFAEILKQVPDSKLLFKDSGYHRTYSIKRIATIMREEGIDNPYERCKFSIGTSHADHLLAYQQADIILDPFPHVGGVVGMEQLYMGVPLIVRHGPHCGSRTTASVLTAIGHPEWIAKDEAEYVEKAVALANDPKTLAEVRPTLRKKLMESACVANYPTVVESAYEAMWQQHCDS